MIRTKSLKFRTRSVTARSEDKSDKKTIFKTLFMINLTICFMLYNSNVENPNFYYFEKFNYNLILFCLYLNAEKLKFYMFEKLYYNSMLFCLHRNVFKKFYFKKMSMIMSFKKFYVFMMLHSKYLDWLTSKDFPSAFDKKLKNRISIYVLNVFYPIVYIKRPALVVIMILFILK